ncbi:hypothetical protein M422DRAFT_183844, partial [Sphaerobolus stellatus SS14]
LPPGPPGKPIIGNALDMPRIREWETYARWAKEYGEIVYVNVLGTPMVFINSRRLAYEVFEKRSSLYSDRMASLPMLRELMGFDWSMAFHRYGVRWRRHRRAMHEKFHPAAVEGYKPVQLKHTRELLRRLLRQPEDYVKHIRHAAGAIIMEIGYGIHIKTENDPYIHIAKETVRAAGEAGAPGRFFVDLLPWMKYIPEWVPGASFQTQAKIWKEYGRKMTELPFQTTKAAMAAGTAEPSFTSSHLEAIAAKKDSPPDAEEVIKNTAAIIFAGGADTTVSSLTTFILAMILFPEVQKKAQAELDDVIGSDRLPEFGDKSALPYTVAIYKETMRWHPLLPLGVPHAISGDDVIEGYFIPKGAIICGNTWSILQDEADFGPDTDKFIPERFLQAGIRSPGNTGAFGFGRRICPGRFMAENSLFISIASILHLFEISGPRDSFGNETPVEYEWTSGILSSPTDFHCTIKPRSKAAEELILSDDKVDGTLA